MALVVMRRYLGSDAGRLLVTPCSAIQVLLCLHQVDLQEVQATCQARWSSFLVVRCAEPDGGKRAPANQGASFQMCGLARAPLTP